MTDFDKFLKEEGIFHDVKARACLKDLVHKARAEGIRLGMERAVKVIEQTPCKDLSNFIVGLTPQDVIKSVLKAMNEEPK